MSVPKNCHYVTRGITTPWEMDQRKLWYYDFQTNKIEDHSSKSLFSGDGLLSQAAELKFKQLIEDPIMEMRNLALKDPTRVQFDWKHVRSVSLYFMGQVQRFNISLQGANNDGSLEEFLKKDNDYYDQLAAAAQKQYQIVGITLPSSKQFFFPQTGFFTFFFLDESRLYKFSSGFAVPLAPHFAMAIIRTDADSSRLLQQLDALSAYSIGTGSNINKVLIPPDIKQANTDNLLIEHFKEKRAQVQTMVTDMFKMKGLVNTMYETVGLTPEDGLASFEIT